MLQSTPFSTDKEASSRVKLSAALRDNPRVFLQPPTEIHDSILRVAKHYLDSLAASVTQVQQARHEQQQATQQRKRKRGADYRPRNVSQLRQLCIEDFSADQVWGQALKIIQAGHRESERALRQAQAAATLQTASGDGLVSDAAEEKIGRQNGARFGKGLVGDSAGGDSSDLAAEEAEEDMALDDVDDEDEDLEEDVDLEAFGEEDIEDKSDSEVDSEGYSQKQEYTKDMHGLNDGFFSIDDFNRQTEFLEQQDVKGDPDDGAASDEEDIDWTLDPTTIAMPKSTKAAALAEDGVDGDETSDDQEDGPTFGNADLDAPWTSDEDGDEAADMDMAMEDEMLANTNDVFYRDFFEPPPQAPAKRSKQPLAKTQPPVATDLSQVNAEDIEKTMSAARRDIFEDEDDAEEEEEATNESDKPSRNLSSHELRQATLAKQIRELEAQAVAKREWAMSGEARATDRPINSLLEEDLEFERTGKPVPVITAEVSSSLEELIKQRILDRQFDEVTKRLPGSASLNHASNRRGLADIDERGPEQQSLAAIYEAEHQQRTDPNYVAPNDAKLKAAHAQIQALWADVSAKLDALSNWHYRPKPPTAEVKVVTDAPRITMEDARPNGIGMAAEESGLAPQEIYRAGSAKEKEEVVTRKGTVLGRGELSREEKQRHYRREQERERKAAGNKEPMANGSGRANGGSATSGAKQGSASAGSKKRADQNALAADLQRAGVKVIGRNGQLVDVEGKKPRAKVAIVGAGQYKL